MGCCTIKNVENVIHCNTHNNSKYKSESVAISQKLYEVKPQTLEKKQSGTFSKKKLQSNSDIDEERDIFPMIDDTSIKPNSKSVNRRNRVESCYVDSKAKKGKIPYNLRQRINLKGH